MKNKLFQIYWFFLRKPISALSVFWNGVDSSWNPSGLIQKRTGLGDDELYMDLSVLIPQMVAQLKAARVFGPVKLIFWGDSNGRMWHQFKTMFSFKYLSLNFAKGGSTVQELADLFKHPDFVKHVLPLIDKGCVHAMNTGGNCALRGHMYKLVSSYKTIKATFEKSFLILIPPIHYWILDPDRGQLKTKVKIVNEAGVHVYGEQAYAPDMIVDFNGDGVPDPGALIDAVHYSNATLHWLKKCVDAILKYKGWVYA